LVGEMLCFVMNQMSTHLRIAGVNSRTIVTV